MPIKIADMIGRLNSESYSGDKKDGFADGQGIYRFSNGIVYAGIAKEGMFDGEGTLTFPLGGKFVAKWNEGKLMNGTYFFQDELQYDSKDWSYCTDADRRFWSDRQNGIRLEDSPQLTDKSPAMWIPAGTYDVGNGYYDPLDGQLYHYSGKFNRVPTQEEVEWVARKCRIGTADEDEEEEEYEYEEEETESEYEEVTDDDEADDLVQDGQARPDSGVRRVTVPLVDTVIERAVESQMSERTFVNHIVESAITNAIDNQEGRTVTTSQATTRPTTTVSVGTQLAVNLVDEVVDSVLEATQTPHTSSRTPHTSSSLNALATNLVDEVLNEALGTQDEVIDDVLASNKVVNEVNKPGSRPMTAVANLVDSIFDEII